MISVYCTTSRHKVLREIDMFVGSVYEIWRLFLLPFIFHFSDLSNGCYILLQVESSNWYELCLSLIDKSLTGLLFYVCCVFIIFLYCLQVLSKFPVIQHFLFGSLLRINAATDWDWVSFYSYVWLALIQLPIRHRMQSLPLWYTCYYSKII